MKTLMLLRHAKSDWDSGVTDDFDRPLASRGGKAAKRMAVWMKSQRIVPDYVMCSSAVRARETMEILRHELTLNTALVKFERRLYLADVHELLAILGDLPNNVKSVMLVGHNPGLEDLLTYLCGDDVPAAANGKLMPTAALARISLPDDWKHLKRGAGVILAVTRPKEL